MVTLAGMVIVVAFVLLGFIGAKMIFEACKKDENLKKIFNNVITIPEISEFLSPLITCIPLQLLAYYIANYLGKDVDQPRNLAKSVTVE